tara:strand:+ start:1599 stop:1736 length:138 start_codon:yes stop_codon:yes gene_type:complete
MGEVPTNYDSYPSIIQEKKKLSRGKIEKSGGIMNQRGKFYHVPLL